MSSKTEVQAVLFKKSGKYDTAAKRDKWLKDHDLELLKGKKVDETEHYWRYRINAPRASYEKRIQRWSANIDAIIQFPKTTRQKKKEQIEKESERDVLESKLLRKKDEAILRLQKEKENRQQLLEDQALARQLKLYQELLKDTQAKSKQVLDSSGKLIETRMNGGIISTIVPY